jgi:hypothetical protein
MTYPVRLEIPYQDDSFTLSMRMPEQWDTPTTVNVTVTDTSGNALVTAQAATVLTANTISAALIKGTNTATLTTDMGLESDDLIRIGSDEQGYQQFVIDTYNSTTKVATFKERVHTAYPSGSAVQARFATYTLDASGWADTVDDVSVEWSPDTDDLATVQLWRVLKRRKDWGGLEETFATTYPTEYKQVDPDGFSVYQDRAHRIISTHWESKGLDLDKLVDSDYEYRELLLLQIAYLIDPTEINQTRYSDYLQFVYNIEKWIDKDQDLIEDESEKVTYTPYVITRRW